MLAAQCLHQRPGHVVISIGPAIDTAGLTQDEINTRTEAWIEAEMRRLSPHRYPDAKPDRPLPELRSRACRRSGGGSARQPVVPCRWSAWPRAGEEPRRITLGDRIVPYLLRRGAPHHRTVHRPSRPARRRTATHFAGRGRIIDSPARRVGGGETRRVAYPPPPGVAAYPRRHAHSLSRRRDRDPPRRRRQSRGVGRAGLAGLPGSVERAR